MSSLRLTISSRSWLQACPLSLLFTACFTDPVVVLDAAESSMGIASTTTTTSTDSTTGSARTDSSEGTSTLGTSTDTIDPDGGSDESTTGEPNMCRSTSPYEGPGECDPYAQDCTEGFKCVPFAASGSSWNSTRCAPLDDNPVGVGLPCQAQGSGVSGEDNCEEGAMCFNVNPETLVGTCRALCACGPIEGVCAEDTVCLINNDGVLPLCNPTCDPLLQNCRSDQACYPVSISGDTSFICAPDASGNAGAAGNSCEFINACDPGLMCADASAVPGCLGMGCCTSFCDLTEGSGICLAGQTCMPFFPGGAPEPELADVGVCAL